MTALLHLILSLLCSFAYAEEITEPGTQLTFPSTIEVQTPNGVTPLSLTGLAVRSKFFVNIYAIAHYMQNPVKVSPSHVYEEIMQDGRIKQFVMKWVHNVDLKSIREACYTGLQKSLPSEYFQQIQADMEKYLSFYTEDAHVGDVHDIRWIPGGTISLTVNGKLKGEIKNLTLAEGLWGIWFGPKSVVNRSKLVKDLLNWEAVKKN